MSAVTDFNAASPPDHELAPYRAICRTAVISAVMAAVSLPLVTLALVSMKYQVGDAVPLGMLGALFAGVALVLGIVGVRTVRRYPTEYTGGKLAHTGVIGGLILLVAGSASAAFTYTTEVPDGYNRVGFWELQPDPDEPGLPISPKAIDLTGKPIFIKGYMHPGVASMGKVNHFILVPDMGTCCFGGQPKPTDMIEVFVPDGKDRVAYSPRRIKLAGTFLLADRPTQSLGLNNVWYHMQVDQVK
ncbi:MAG TPA: DUF3299 domain-containing protein [Pirellulaceae bacterium]|nr:DUF3299 domain-containing protein [Pirellulaceae bacterium]